MRIPGLRQNLVLGPPDSHCGEGRSDLKIFKIQTDVATRETAEVGVVLIERSEEVAVAFT